MTTDEPYEMFSRARRPGSPSSILDLHQARLRFGELLTKEPGVFSEPAQYQEFPNPDGPGVWVPQPDSLNPTHYRLDRRKRPR